MLDEEVREIWELLDAANPPDTNPDVFNIIDKTKKIIFNEFGELHITQDIIRAFKKYDIILAVIDHTTEQVVYLSYKNINIDVAIAPK